MRSRLRQRLQLLYFILSINIFFFLVIYHRLVLVTSRSLRLTIIDPGHIPVESVCHIPQFDPWDQTVAKAIRIKPVYRCVMKKRNLVEVTNFTQLMINQTVNVTYHASSITHCTFARVDRNPEEKLFRDWSYTVSEARLIENGRTAPILDADFVLTRCYNDRTGFFDDGKFW